ncbi:MAG TPA: epoxyqueuosine reductase QueH [Planctomycetota bacterium]|nr:epoxyqueuosine reductase QueH [Planctomycetota bacterium]
MKTKATEPTLIHACCAPCLCALLDELREDGVVPTALFCNPNIHPLIEFRRRLKACQVLADRERLPLVACDAYGLESFLDAIGARRARPERCHACYAMRLDATARYAAEHGFPRFTSTLLVSPQQDRDALCTLGHAAAGRYGVAFDDTDRRHLHDRGMEQARRLQLYRQQYCGCIFSEHERYRDTAVELYRGARQPGPRAAPRSD